MILKTPIEIPIELPSPHNTFKVIIVDITLYEISNIRRSIHTSSTLFISGSEKYITPLSVDVLRNFIEKTQNISKHQTLIL